MFNIAFYSGHNASFTISKDDKILEVIDLERWVNIKNVGLFWYEPKISDSMLALKHILKYFKEKYGADEYENVICNSGDVKSVCNFEDNILKFFNAKNLITFWHQDGHAYNAFYQSKLETANIISFDGGGDDGCFSIYSADRKNGIKLERKEYEYNLGDKYAYIGYLCESIKQEQNPLQGMITYSGKLMGLSAYGNVLNEHLPAFYEYYKGHHHNNTMRLNNFSKIQTALGLPLGNNMINGQIEKDIVRTSQFVFENLFQKICKPEIEKSKDNLILTGGCAMNILNNTSVNNITKTFISPNPEDRGLSLGFMLGYLKPNEPFDSTYIGPEVWDKHNIFEYVDKYNAKSYRMRQMVHDLALDGKIIGVVRGRSEHGARALGNRSILCSPKIKDMKNTLNAKIKGREYFRPFAPVVRLEDVNKYFEWEGESRWMSYCPKVRPEWRGILEAVTHADGTARVQTVTREQNEFLYDLLSMLELYENIGVLLNTSFNIAGKPILNTYRDAIWMWQNTQMDQLLLEDYIFKK